MNSDPQHSHQKPRESIPIIPAWGKQRCVGVCCAARLAKLASWRFSEKLSQVSKAEGDWENWCQAITNPYTHTMYSFSHVHTYVNVCTYTCMHPHMFRHLYTHAHTYMCTHTHAGTISFHDFNYTHYFTFNFSFHSKPKIPVAYK